MSHCRLISAITRTVCLKASQGVRIVIQSPDDRVRDASTFSKNRDRLPDGDVFQHFLSALLAHPKVAPLLSAEHFSVDGTLIEAWASHKSFKPKDGQDGDGENFHDQKRTNETHQSTTDPEARLYRTARRRSSLIWAMR